jgi:hypothetical protein
MAEQPDLSRELSRMETEPLLAVEKKLIAGSLILGVLLLVILGLVAHWMGPGA